MKNRLQESARHPGFRTETAQIREIACLADPDYGKTCGEALNAKSQDMQGLEEQGPPVRAAASLAVRTWRPGGFC